MTPPAAMLTWLALLLLLGLELLLALFPAMHSVPPLVGVGMAGIVALTFMRLGSSRGLVQVFALAGAFWLCILLGLGSLDPFTRHDVAVDRHTTPD